MFDDRLVASVYDGYPVMSWEDDKAVYVVEGIIFNITETKIKEIIKSIALSLSIEQVGCFVKEADGDFVVCIYLKDTKQALIFNDELGGLPFYFFQSKELLVSGRNCTYIAALSNDIELSKENLAEFTCFDYNMGDRTIFKHIKALLPASYLLCNETDNGISVKIGPTVERSYCLSNRYKTKDEAIKSLKELYLAGCKTRCDYAKSHGYSIVNTMSGGYDSRTVMAGIESCIPSESYQNLTYEYKQDESIVASKVLKAVGSKSEYIKLSYENIPNLYDVELSFKTEGKISAYTNSVCYNDLKYSYDHFFKGRRILYFGGFGGEFIRHPLFSTIWNASNIGCKSNPSLKDTSKLFGVKYKTTQALIRNTFEDCKTSESFCKKFYDDYYRRYVRGAGEERVRMFYVSVQPMMSKDFILAIRNRVPLDWVGYEFHTAFLRALNPLLTSVELYGGVPNIFSMESLRKSDYKNKSLLHGFMRRIAVRYHLKNYKKGDLSYDKLSNLLKIDNLYDEHYLSSHFKEYTQNNQCKLASVLFYVNKLINRKKL
jgi:hypothetical protein